LPDTASDLFRFASAVRRDPAIDSWLDAQPGALGLMARSWFKRLRSCGPDIRELMHDGCPVACVEDAAFADVNVFTTHINVVRHVKLRPGLEPNVRALNNLIEEAYLDIRRRLDNVAVPD
jgi:hypothetical protein